MKKASWFLALFMALSMAISGCSAKKAPETTAEETTTAAPLTAEEIMALSKNAMNDIKSYSGNMQMKIEMAATSQGETRDMSIGMDMDMDVIMETMQAHMTGSMSMMGINMDMETYMVEEDGKMVTYSGMYDTWTKTETVDPSTMDQLKQWSAENLFMEGMQYELSEDPVTVNGREAYKITVAVSGEACEHIMDSYMGMMGDMGSMMGDMGYDYSALTADMEMLVYTDDYYCAKTTVKMGGFEDMMSALLKDLEDVQLKVGDMTMTTQYTAFNNLTEIVVPEEVKSAVAGEKQEMGTDGILDPVVDGAIAQDDQGKYMLEAYFAQDQIKAAVAMPEGFTLDEENSDHTVLFFDKMMADPENHEMYVAYTVLELDNDVSADDLGKVHQNSVREMMADTSYTNVSTSPLQTIESNGQTIYYTVLSYTYGGAIQNLEYNCWMVLDETNVIRCEIYEMSYDGSCDTIEDEKMFISYLFECATLS
ncbi:MAG: hypothetical protein IKU83_05910 [Lachnospiraceae bacterium]|nr:hypothetical protein [Lachnospiraceae bacterium]